MTARLVGARELARFRRALKGAAGCDDWAEVAALAEARIAEQPDSAEAHYVMALAAVYRDDLAAALQAATRACDLAPETADHQDLLALVYGLAGDVNAALFHGKAAAGCSRRSAFARIVPESFPTLAQVFIQIRERPLLARGLAAMERGRWTDAEVWLRQHLAFAPDCAEAAAGLGESLLAQDQPLAAVEALRGLRHVLPGDARLASLLGRALGRIGEFDQARACHGIARSLAPEDGEIAAAALLDAAADPQADQAATAADLLAWGKTFGVDDGRAAPPAGCRGPRPLTLGYLVANAGGRPDAPWLADILSRRRSDRFAVVGFGYGPLSTPSNVVFQKCVDRWQDVSGADAFTLAAMVRAETVDILVDLAGLDAPALHAAFASRMAPCQVAWLGTPSLGLGDFDAVLTHRCAAPGSAPCAKILRLGSVPVPPPACLARPPREQGGEILLMADAGLGELNAVTVERWAAILHAVPEAKLVLRDRGFTQADALKRVLDIFGTFGVAHRVDVIAEASPAAFFAHGDIALLPYPCPSPASLGEALSAGLPVVCPAGEAPWSRAAASVLDHLGLAADTVAPDGGAYLALALRWAGSPDERAAFPVRLEQAARASRLWDQAARAEDLFAALEAAWDEIAAREEPHALAAGA
ncbi:MAG: hypothetical protein MUD06_05530 [Rhodospirillales bacterium]|jgi:tetratricopeptide (TPR) repeat protein|nr:hypothetical protein [Rhodospirillales bacterium]